MKTWVKLVLVLGGVAALLAFVFISNEEEEARRTAKGTAVVTAVEFKRDTESSSLDETEYTLRLASGEAKATLPGDRSANFPVGHTFAVCYDPANIGNVDIQ